MERTLTAMAALCLALLSLAAGLLSSDELVLYREPVFRRRSSNAG